jgi:hypothetical protein
MSISLLLLRLLVELALLFPLLLLLRLIFSSLYKAKNLIGLNSFTAR